MKSNNLLGLIEAAEKMPSNWHRREIFLKIAIMSQDSHYYELLQTLVKDKLRENAVFLEASKFQTNNQQVFIVPNKNLGDRINFVFLSCLIARQNMKKAVIILQDDSISSIFKSLDSDIVEEFVTMPMNENDLWLYLNKFSFKEPFVLNWWTFELQNQDFFSKVQRYLNLEWIDFIKDFKYSMSKWDMLTQMYSVLRSEKKESFIYDFQYALELFKKNNLCYGRSVMIAPIANTLKGTPKINTFFNDLVDALQHLGFDCFENVKPGEENRKILKNTIALAVPAEKLPSIMHFAKNLIAFRSGICDLAHLLDVNLHVIYPERPRGVETSFAGWSCNSSEQNLSEYFLDIHKTDEVIKCIVNQFKEVQ